MKRKLLFLLLILSFLLSACENKRIEPEIFNSRKTELLSAFKLLDPQEWDAALEIREEASRTAVISLSNKHSDTITAFHYGVFHTMAYDLQKRNEGQWQSIDPDDGPTTLILEDDKWLHIPPGGKASIHIRLDPWEKRLQKGEEARLLLGVFPGAVQYADVSRGVKPLGYLSFIFPFP